MTLSNITPVESPCENTLEPSAFRQAMLDWYDVHKRDLPWRDCGDPYKIWLSEVMLQQTTVAAVIKYFLKFTEKWPDVHALAKADNDDVMAAWAGLGYYARARNLHKCAQVVASEFDGAFPCTQDELRKLPGIGDYTSAAIASIAFDKPAVVVDGNIERVMARYHAYDGAKKTLKSLAQPYAEGFSDRPGDYAQALMDLGATICTPKSPACTLCPINQSCVSFQEGGDVTRFPVKSKKLDKPRRVGYVYWVENSQGDILLEKRPEKGLLGGMIGFPTSDWSKNKLSQHHTLFSAAENIDNSVFHVFTHFHLELKLCKLKNYHGALNEHMFWHSADELKNIGFPSLFKKVFKLLSS